MMKPLEKNIKTVPNFKDNGKNVLLISSVFIFFSVLLGVFTGWLISNMPNKDKEISKNKTTQEVSNNKKVVGIIDKKKFKDSAEGILREGGIDGEGQFHLERPGGPSQNVYLTSTTVDLSQFIGKKIRVWGETFSAQKAGWLMNVGFIEIL